MATGYDDPAGLAEKLRTRALRVEVVAPRGRVLPAQGGPPALTLRVLSRGFAPDSLTCFATGQGRAGVVWLDRQRREVQVRAVAPLPVGRSTHTCTAPVAGRPGAYFWFSHRWLKPRAGFDAPAPAQRDETGKPSQSTKPREERKSFRWVEGLRDCAQAAQRVAVLRWGAARARHLRPLA